MKKLLNEWQTFLSENRIIPLAELLDIIRSSTDYTNSDVTKFTNFWKSNQFSSKYSQVIKNDLLKGEPVDHIVDAVTSHYKKVYQTVGPKIKSSIGGGSYTSDDLRKDLDTRLGLNKFNKNEVRQLCQYSNGRPVVGKYKDFDVVYSESDWIVIEPKTIQGSIAWAHGKPDGSEETDQARRVGWCTGVTSSNNMFPNYAGNLHMFYLIKSDYDNVYGPDRRICLSFIKRDKVDLMTGDASVDANNSALTAEYVEEHVDESIIKLIKTLVSGRKETSFAEIYSKITLSQLIRQIKQMKSQGISKEDFKQELSNYASYTQSEEVIGYLMTSFTEDYDLHTSIVMSVGDRPDLADLAGGSVINNLLKDEDPEIRALIAQSSQDKDILLALARDEDSGVRGHVARNYNTHKDILLILAKDEETGVRREVAENENTPEEALLILAKDEDSGVRDYAISSLEDIKSESILKNYIKLLMH